MTRLPEHVPGDGARKTLDLRPLAISRWENEGGAVPDGAWPVHGRILVPLRRGVLLTSAQTPDVL
jgi:hypothetical protein